MNKTKQRKKTFLGCFRIEFCNSWVTQNSTWLIDSHFSFKDGNYLTNVVAVDGGYLFSEHWGVNNDGTQVVVTTSFFLVFPWWGWLQKGHKHYLLHTSCVGSYIQNTLEGIGIGSYIGPASGDSDYNRIPLLFPVFT